MKRFLLICLILLTVGSLFAQTPKVSDLITTSGTAIKWYSLTTGGTLYTGSEALVNGQHYYASQTVNSVESSIRLDVIATIISCITAPTLTTSAVSNIGSTSATVNGNISSINGANVTTRGFKYSTTNGFDPASTGTNISENGTFGTGAFSLSPSGLATTTTYYAVAYATNSAGTTYGNQVNFNTLIQTDYAYTGSQQTFVVPAGVSTITIKAWGAQGGTANGGLGGYSTGNLSVSQGQTLFLYVGGQGATGQTGGFNGGGTGGYDTNGGGTIGSGGGGASDVRTGTIGLGNRVLVAGGGGGRCPSSDGGSGGGTNGSDAIDVNTGYGGHGGTQSAGGTSHTNRNATDGGWGYGGNGSTNYNAWGGGGGGGGYYGGGGGTSTQDHGSGYSGGGGGGSSYLGGVTSGSTTAGQRTGDGRIFITY